MHFKDRFKNSEVTDDRKQLIADRWSNPDELTARINKGMNVDLAALQDWFGYCRFKYPSKFRGWTIAQFKDWNDRRIEELDGPTQMLSTAVARKRIWESTGKRMWNPDTKQLEPSQWNDANGDFELIPAK